MKQLVENVVGSENTIQRQSQIIGYVERIEHHRIDGWALHRRGHSLDLSVRVKGNNYTLQPEWFNRADVAEHYGSQFSQAGFCCYLPEEVQNLLEYSDMQEDSFKIMANDTELNIVTSLPEPVVDLIPPGTKTPGIPGFPEPVVDLIPPDTKSPGILSFPEPVVDLKQESFLPLAGQTQRLKQTDPFLKNPSLIDKQGSLRNSPQGAVESWGHFIIKGWVTTENNPPESLTLKCNGVPLNCVVVRHTRLDIKAESSLGMDESDFEIELPGFLWEYVVEGKEAQLTITLGEKLLHDEPLCLSHEKSIDWLADISGMDTALDKQYFSLLAVEHLRFSKLFHKLPQQAQQYYLSFAQQMQLDEYLACEADETSTSKSVEQITETDPDTLILWKAQRELNNRLIDSSCSVFEHVEAVLKDMRLSGAVADSYVRSVIPLLCRHDQLLKLRQLTSFARFYELEQGSNAWEISLSLAVLVADMEIERATGVIYKLTEQLDTGWLNTECIHFAVVHSLALAEQGSIDQRVAEDLNYAFIGLLDGFKGDWFSRLHDQMLIEALVMLLQNLSTMTDYHQRDLVNTAIRNYGLNPVFWQLIADRGVQPDDSLFVRAYQQWKVFYETLNLNTLGIAENLSELQVPIDFFIQQKNPEALVYLREILANAVTGVEGLNDISAAYLIRKLIDRDPIEALRLAASPTVENAYASSMLKAYQTDVFDSLRLKTKRKHSRLYGSQIGMSDGMKALQQALLDGNKTEISAAYINVQNLAVPFNNMHGMFLSADMLAGAYKNIRGQQTYSSDGLIRLNQAVQRAVAESKANFYLPAPVCAAIATINSLPKTDLTNGWLQKIQTLLINKFGARHNILFDKPECAAATNITDEGWPQDTLVVIYSCCKYLDSRIATIRNTWVKDLKARGIPYVVLVGDGDDTLQGDVLALDVSDNYEDLPTKTLKLFEWLYKNTNAQYVLKIDDDCYLNVDRYFDTLSYRKHHYYGRVIHRSVGGMDRAWHHSKSQTERARKAIDKSPEPSIYADGGGGYSLSRIAIAVLLENASSEGGRKLIANSFMEDKLVGDLLSLSHIKPSNEDYECYQRRRTFCDAVPVGMWENSFFPASITPTKVVHLDTDKDHLFVHSNRCTDELWPKKIWPSCWAASINESANQLELLTAVEKTNILLSGDLYVVVVVRNEMLILPHFLEYYRTKGVKTFIIADNCSDDGSREYLLEQPDVVLYSADTEYKYSHYGVAWQQAILANHCINKWVLVADADELLVYPNCEEISLPEFVSQIDAEGADCVRTNMIDMYPYGDLNDADFTNKSPFEIANWFDANPLNEWRIGSGRFSNRISFVSSMRHRIDSLAEPNAFTSQKYALLKYKPWFRLSQGIHDAAGVDVSQQRTWFAHFKYHAGFKEKVQAEIRRGQHFNNAKEYRRYAAMLAEGTGCFGKDDVSKNYINSKSFIDMGV